MDSVFISGSYDDDVLAIGLFPNVNFARSLFGSSYYAGAEGDIFINLNSVANDYGYEPGQAGFSLLLHEIGHALGLKHPHDDGGTGRPTFEEAGFGDLDIDWMTVMSYDDSYSWNDNSWDPATPMILDVIALQYLYGANTHTNAGDTVYKPSGNTGFYETVFDASGHDKIDLSNYGKAATVLLPSIVISEDQYAPFGLVLPVDDAGDEAPHQLSWFLGTIEELVGTPFDDEFYGGDSAEVISGGGGDDYIEPGAGNDTVDGGDGEDTASVLADYSDCVITFDGKDCIVQSADDGRDIYRNVEFLFFGDADSTDIRSVADIKTDQTLTPSTGWRLYALSDAVAEIGGSGVVVGTAGPQDIRVADVPGHVTFDASFNRGGDIIRLHGEASQWTIRDKSTSAFLSDGDTFIEVPIGPTGSTIVFDDGALVLRFDSASKSPEIGSQHYTAISESIDPAGLADSPAEPASSGPREKLYIAPGGEASAGGLIDFFGTNSAETVSVTHGTATFDASFNRGGDTIRFQQDSASFTISFSISSVHLHSSLVDVTIPIGSNALHLSFNGVSHDLRFDPVSHEALIGNQVLGSTPAPLTFA